MMTGHQRAAAVCGVASLVLLASLAAILGHFWGPNGVAVAAGISLSVYKVSLALLGWRLLNIRCWVDPTLRSVFHLIAQRRR
jgi:O-antigen/teichoic acid export membrane protein